MLFGRGKKSKDEQAETAAAVDESGTAAGSPEAAEGGTRGDFRLGKGPLDIDEIEDRDGYVDLGALLISPAEGLQLRLEVEEATQRVVAVTMDLAGSSLQLQAFAAPRSEGLWDEIREQITQSVASQGGETEEIPGTFGTELVAKLPAEATDGSRGFRAARFMGVDGPRWFLRGVLGEKLPWTVTPRPASKSSSAALLWSVATTRCHHVNCCSFACPRTQPRPASLALRRAHPACSSRNGVRRSPRLADTPGRNEFAGQPPLGRACGICLCAAGRSARVTSSPLRISRPASNRSSPQWWWTHLNMEASPCSCPRAAGGRLTGSASFGWAGHVFPASRPVYGFA